jgi:cyclopropane fatty-acyl-phospholipid synthase-like methyltransferase
MPAKKEWEKFFDGHAPVYMDNVFVKNTLEEVDFVLAELKLPQSGHILDMGCGTGRHAIELAKRGYRVTGVDISAGMLAEAEKTAQKAGVQVNWIHGDATKFTTRKSFDAAVCLCEGAFGLLSTEDDPEEHDLAILRSINGALKPSAPFLLTALNGYRMIRLYQQKDIAAGSFDPIHMVELSLLEVETAAGKKTYRCRERGHLPTELALLLKMTGFEIEHIGGGTAGNWGKRPLEPDEMEIMVIARKSAGKKG